jgi:Ala-tRNA(Pro) deacylase
MNGKERLQSYLREQGVPFEEQTHPEAFTSQAVASSEHVPGDLVAKVVIVLADGRPAMLVLPAPHLVDLRKSAAVLGASEVSIAREDEFAALFPDCELGAMPPFGNLYEVPVYVDRHIAEHETIICEAGTHTETISLSYADFERLVQPVAGEICTR